MPLPDLFISFLSAAIASLVFCLLKIALDKSMTATEMAATGTGPNTGLRLHRRAGMSSSTSSAAAPTHTTITFNTLTSTTSPPTHTPTLLLPPTTVTAKATTTTGLPKSLQGKPPSRKRLKVSFEERSDSLGRRCQYEYGDDDDGCGVNPNAKTIDSGQSRTTTTTATTTVPTTPTPSTATTSTAFARDSACRRVGGRKLSIVLEEERPPPPSLSEA